MAGILQNGSNMAWVESHPKVIADLLGQMNNVGRYNLSFTIIVSTKQLEEHDRKKMRLLIDDRRFNADIMEHAKLREPVIQEVVKRASKKTRVTNDEYIGYFQIETGETKIALTLKSEPRIETSLFDPKTVKEGIHTAEDEAWMRAGEPTIVQDFIDEKEKKDLLGIDLNGLVVDLSATKVTCNGKSVCLSIERETALWTFKDESMTRKLYHSIVHFEQPIKKAVSTLRNKK